MADELHVSRGHLGRAQTPLPAAVVAGTPPERSPSASRRPKKSVASGAARVGVPAIAVALLLAACTAAPGAPVAKAVTTAPPKPGPYVALGDSYTSGPDIPTQVGAPAGCRRSDHNYPSLLAERLGLKAGQFHDVSCSGATISNLTAPQDTGNGVNPAQLTALAADTALVTLGIGGNDIGFASVMTRCVELDVPSTLIDLVRNSTTDSAPCRAFFTAHGGDQIEQKVQAASAHLADALSQIHRLAPHARVYVIGYPGLLPSSESNSCALTLGITSGDAAFLSSEEDRLNAMLQQQARAAGDTYVDTYTPSLGHDACSGQTTRWIEPLMPVGAAQLHPNALGEQAMADAAEHFVGGVS